MSFAELGLIEPLVQCVTSEGYTQPTPIQTQAIPHVLAGKDLLACAQTGTGKTAAFALPILQRIDTQRQAAISRAPRVVVISPTRELAAQIGQSFATYGRNIRFRQTVIFGGVGQRPQVRALDHGVHVLIATPGRLLDLMEQGYIRFDKLEVLVLDEADRMLDLGFLPDLKRIISQLPRQRQSLFFSATMPESILGLANGLLNNPVRVSVTPPATTVDLIEQQVLFVERGNKRALLHKVLSGAACDRALVFTRTKHGADKVAQQLNQNGVQADAIHGNKSQHARERTLSQFRAGRLRVLVATDLAARGIDVEGISHVINYDLPQDAESYVHRIGRTGRAGASGVALTFCDSEERVGLRAIEKLIRRNLAVDSNHPYHVASGNSTVGSSRAVGKNRFRPKTQQGGRRHFSGKRRSASFR
jgi:ATP-dependent RNA helicase RhlE